MRRLGFAGDAVAIAAALAVHFFTPPATWIEANYSNGAYPAIDRAVRFVTGPFWFCVGDVLFFAAVAWLVRYWIVAFRRAPAGAKRAASARIFLRTLAIAAGIFVWFEASWAFNYARVPLADKIPVHNERTDEDSVAAFADHVTDRLNALGPAAHKEQLTDEQFETELETRENEVFARLGDRAHFTPPRIKPTIFQTTMQLSASNGFTDPWTHEVNVDSSLFDFERPAIYAHEWSHIAGFADETEANFISVVTCTTSHDPYLQYSGWLLVWFNLPENVHLSHTMDPVPYADIMAIRNRYKKQVNQTVEHVQRAAYDQYLKQNRVKAGYASYRLFIRWMTGADFDRGGLPIVRPGFQRDAKDPT